MKKFVHVLKEKLNQGSSQDYVRQQQTPNNQPSKPRTNFLFKKRVLQPVVDRTEARFGIWFGSIWFSSAVSGKTELNIYRIKSKMKEF